MEWTKEDKERLLSFRQTLDCDDIKLKQEIKQRLLGSKDIIHVLNNKELEAQDAEPDDYFGVNIFPVYLIADTQHNVQNFICYETSFERVNRYSLTALKRQTIIFYISCESKNCIDNETSLPRHDLLAALVENLFNYEVLSCGRIRLAQSKPSITDNNYCTRTLIFECETDRNLVKTKDGTPMIINKELPIVEKD